MGMRSGSCGGLFLCFFFLGSLALANPADSIPWDPIKPPGQSGPGFPGGSFGRDPFLPIGSYYCSNNYGSSFDPRAGTRQGPTIYPACNLDPEYDCPLFENRPHQGLINALDSLRFAMNATPECQEHPASLQDVRANTEQIRAVISQLQAAFENPSFASVDVAQLEQGMESALRAANQLGQIFSNSTLMNSPCGQKLTGGGKALVALNGILNGLAPYALMASSVNPAIGGALNFALTGGAIATSAISGIMKMVNEGRVDMSVTDHRRALLKNTCQFTKVARKVRLMQLAQSGKVREITRELEAQVEQTRARFQKPSPSLQRKIKQYQRLKTQQTSTEKSLHSARLALADFNQRLEAAKQDDLFTCLIGTELAQIDPGQIDLYPSNVMGILQVSVNNLDLPTQNKIKTMMRFHLMSRQGLLNFAAQMDSGDPSSVPQCAQSTRSWALGLSQAQAQASSQVAAAGKALEESSRQDLELSAWMDQERLVHQEQQTASRMGSVMQELARDNSVIDRSELDQSLLSVKNSLFGARGQWNWSRSPIHEWLEYTLGIHQNRIKSFDDNIKNLRTAAHQIRLSGQMTLSLKSQLPDREELLKAALEVPEEQALDSLTSQRLPPGSRGHELACQLLETSWLDWIGALDHLGATEFMCDLVDSHIDNKVAAGIKNFCRGELRIDGKPLKDSRIVQTKASLVNPRFSSDGRSRSRNGKGQSYRDWAEMIALKTSELKCPFSSQHEGTRRSAAGFNQEPANFLQKKILANRF